MTITVAYRTMTGHSRKIAVAVAKALNVEAVDIKKQPEIGDSDMLFIVGGIYGGASNPDLVKFAESLDSSRIKRAALITSCASRKFFQKEVRAALVARGIDVVTEEVVCWGNFLFYGLGHPNKTDFDAAINFAKKYL